MNTENTFSGTCAEESNQDPFNLDIRVNTTDIGQDASSPTTTVTICTQFTITIFGH